ncbi:hypothetical protein EGW08_012828 [Elysia chlorotica]|uniref:BTB domain-containing protein n=1 Tax=Elysia chlorotica TaxID=188477 RepID=A0A433TCV2_ELYCH|nr:hypothetical protein EGW08_012828 [Elysia chlorotica]
MAADENHVKLETAKTAFEDQISLREEQALCDVVVVVEDTEFPCHRAILAAISDFFKAALTTDMMEARERRISLENITKETFSTLIAWIYTGQCNVTEENLADVERAADMLGIQFIIDQCLVLRGQISGAKLKQDASMELETARRIFEGLMSLREEQILSDVVVVVQSSEFPCHAVILSAVSSYFKNILTNDMENAKERRISLKNVTKETFSTLLTCIYSGKCDLSEENLFDVWAAADTLGVRFISGQCMALREKMFDAKRTQHTCMDQLVRLRPYVHEAKRVLDYIARRFKSHIIRSDRRPFTMEEVRYLVAKNDLEYWSENDVVEFVLTMAVKHSPPAHNLADVLECTRYLLISLECLYGSVAQHPLVRSDAACQALMEKVCWYQGQPHLQQTWCPPPAIHREHSDLANVLLMCQISREGHVIMLRLKDMEWKKLSLAKLEQCNADVKLLCYKSTIYALYGNRIYEYSPTSEDWQGAEFAQTQDLGVVCVVNDSLHQYSCNNRARAKVTAVSRHKLLDFPLKERCRLPCKTLHKISTEESDVMKVRDVTSIGSTEIIFCETTEADNCTILATSEACCSPQTYPTQLDSSSALTTFRHDREAFVLQGNGSLWRLQLGDALPHINIEKVQRENADIALWTGEVSLSGAVLYNDELIIVGDFQDQPGVCATLDQSLPGVFKAVRKIKSCLSGKSSPPGITLAVLPKTLLA